MRPFLLSSYDSGHATLGQAARSYFQLYSLTAKYRDLTFLLVSFLNYSLACTTCQRSRRALAVPLGGE